MNELDDLSICKRIGEIESLNGDFGTHLNGAHGRRYIDGSFKYYNPLTDDALCFQFCYKDDIRVSFTECPAGSGRAYWAVRGGLQTDYCDTPNRAVCMAKLKVFSND